MLQYAVEPLSAMQAEEARNLFDLHWKEIAEEKSVLQLDPDWETYQAAEDNGTLVIVTARLEGELVGYVVAFVRRHPHYRTVICGFEDLHFLRSDLRGNGSGRAMILFAMDAMRARGAKMMFIHGKLGHDSGEHLRVIGFRPMDYLFVKRL